jgi:hypothetical protein
MTHAAQWFPGNQAIPIGAGTPPATVASGSLAVFAVNRETGERLHLFSLISGDSLLPLAVPPDAAWEIAAVPLETTCLQPTADLREWECIFALENRLAKIGEPLARFRPAAHLQFVEAGRPLNLKTGQRVAVEQGIVFLRLESGAGSLSGVPVQAEATVALIPGLWLEAAGEPEWHASAHGDAATLAHTLDLAVRCLFDALYDVKKQRQTTDRERFRVRRELNRHISGAALGEFAGIARKGIGAASERSSGDPLFDAVRAAVRCHPRNRRRLRDARPNGVAGRRLVASGERPAGHASRQRQRRGAASPIGRI